MNLSKKLKLNISGHSDIDFVDIKLNTDTALYLDPTLIDGLPITWCEESSAIISDYFNNVFQACKDRNYLKLSEFVQFGHEPNETKLGISLEQSQGKGSNPERLFKMFKSISDLVEKKYIVNPVELCIFIKNFAEDRMSDLITNILKKQLYDFTVLQCEKHNITSFDKNLKINCHYWDIKTHSWLELVEKSFVVEGQVILLVPKQIVRKSFIINTSQYIYKQILTMKQDYHLAIKSDLTYKTKSGTTKPPTKKELYKKEIKGKDLKEYALKFTEENPDAIEQFRRKRILENEIWNYVMSDFELDKLLYRIKK